MRCFDFHDCANSKQARFASFFPPEVSSHEHLVSSPIERSSPDSRTSPVCRRYAQLYQAMYTFQEKTSADKLKELLDKYHEFSLDDTSSTKAEELCTLAWHLTDWVYEEFGTIHCESNLGSFRETLYLQCSQLKLVHDIANGSKHSKVSRPKAQIKKTKTTAGPYSAQYSREYDKTRLEIEMEDGTVLHFLTEIETIIEFWKNYFKNVLGVST